MIFILFADIIRSYSQPFILSITFIFHSNRNLSFRLISNNCVIIKKEWNQADPQNFLFKYVLTSQILQSCRAIQVNQCLNSQLK